MLVSFPNASITLLFSGLNIDNSIFIFIISSLASFNHISCDFTFLSTSFNIISVFKIGLSLFNILQKPIKSLLSLSFLDKVIWLSLCICSILFISHIRELIIGLYMVDSVCMDNPPRLKGLSISGTMSCSLLMFILCVTIAFSMLSKS